MQEVKRTKDEIILSNSMFQLAGVLEKKLHANASYYNESEALFCACQEIGKELGLKFHPLPKFLEEYSEIDKLTALTELSHIFKRRVCLVGDWWKRTTSPILAYWKVENNKKQPISIMRAKNGQYLIYNPTTNKRFYLNKKNVENIETIGWIFYKTFPQGELNKLKIFRFLNIPPKEISYLFIMFVFIGIISLVFPLCLEFIMNSVIPNSEIYDLKCISFVLIIFMLSLFFFPNFKRISFH